MPPDSIRPVREPTERSYTLWVCDGCEAVGLVSEPCESCWDPLTRVEVVPVAEVERLRAERRELREALAFYDPHAPAAIEHECRDAS
jgi:hypothetical protein